MSYERWAVIGAALFLSGLIVADIAQKDAIGDCATGFEFSSISVDSKARHVDLFDGGFVKLHPKDVCNFKAIVGVIDGKAASFIDLTGDHGSRPAGYHTFEHWRFNAPEGDDPIHMLEIWALHDIKSARYREGPNWTLMGIVDLTPKG